jgi:hypothetical protein
MVRYNDVARLYRGRKGGGVNINIKDEREIQERGKKKEKGGRVC